MSENTTVLSAVIDPATEKYVVGEGKKTSVRTIESLGWSKEKALEVRMRLLSCAEDWDHPSMEVYDAP